MIRRIRSKSRERPGEDLICYIASILFIIASIKSTIASNSLIITSICGTFASIHTKIASNGNRTASISKTIASIQARIASKVEVTMAAARVFIQPVRKDAQSVINPA